jgi:histidine triad (HIT) family protein
MDDCVFCGIAAGEIPSRTVYENDHAVAFLDANPLAPGHTVVIPREHHRTLQDLPDDAGNAVFGAIRRVTSAVEGAVDADATTVGFNNGEAAGQEVPHVHGHVIPRFEGDGGGPIHAVVGERPDLSDDRLDGIAEELGDRL